MRAHGDEYASGTGVCSTWLYLIHFVLVYQRSKTTAKHPVSHGNCQAAVVEGQMRFRNGGPVLIIDVLSVSASLKSCAETTQCFEDARKTRDDQHLGKG